MLRRIKIENLRGVAEGELESLSRLTALIGPNGSGKSTILEACLVGADRFPAAALGSVTQRRGQTWNGAKWIVRGGDEQLTASIEVEWDDGATIRREVRWDPALLVPELRQWLSERGEPGPYSAFRISRTQPPLGVVVGFPDGGAFAVTGIAANNVFRSIEVERDLKPPPVRLVEGNRGEQLHDLFSRAVKAGRRDEVVDLARTVVPGLRGIEILTEESEPRLFLRSVAGAVPATLAGDGVVALLRTVFELASPAGGTVLLEEPELHLHPRALLAQAEAIVAAVRRGVQVILTTHSLEFIDLLLSQLSDQEVGDDAFATVRKVHLADGVLTSIPILASEAEHARTALAEDLR